ncbi:MAG: hypothetical protein FVQ80_07095 [Planctomycetes bacterium]|nr:hypothetical protein [Planctomycetota bacterium]
MPVDFPSGTTGITKAYQSIEEVSHRGTVRAPFEGGYEQTRAKWTRSRKEWTIRWKDMSNNSHTSLVTFFESTVVGGASSWVWHNPISNSTAEVRFVDDQIRFLNSNQKYWSGAVRIREV